jgi:hypothetical protein
VHRSLTLLCGPICALTLTACASTVSTAGFKGAQQEVAQTVANLQTDVTAGEQKKICANDLAAAAVARLGGSKGCEAAVKSQLAEIDSFEASVLSVKLAAGETSATAQVKSIRQGKSSLGTIKLVKEAGKWKISGVG